MPSISPPALSTGSNIKIISTARAINPDELYFSYQILNSWFWQYTIGKTIGERENQFAGSDEIRRQDLQEALDDAEINCILFARGGYGTVRILDELSYEKICRFPKWLVGYSDMTALFMDLYTKTGLPSLHAPMPIGWEKNSADCLQEIKKILEGGKMHYKMEPHPLNKLGYAEGILLGGNLSVIYSLLGSRSEPNWEQVILFLEDIGEYLYHLDRMMMALSRRGVLQKIVGLVIGRFSEMKDNTIPFGFSAEEIIAHHLKTISIPVVFQFSAGHIPHNLPLKMGVNTVLTVAPECVILRENGLV